MNPDEERVELMQVKNVLLTGAGGKIGRAVLPELAKAGYQVRAWNTPTG